MCSFCERKEIVERSPELHSRIDTTISLRVDEENPMYLLRLKLGSAGYTLPIMANFCMFCGEKLSHG